jgi:outer membrane autotransporter protein
MGGSENNTNTVSAWLDSSDHEDDSLAANIADRLNELSQIGTGEEITKAVTALSPETNGTVQTMALNTVSTIANTVGSRMSGGSNFLGMKGMSSGDSKTGMAVWAQGLRSHAKLSDFKSAKGFKADTSGAAVGVESNFTDNIMLGLGYAYAYSDIKGYGRNTGVNSGTIIFYGEYKPSDLFVNAIVSHGSFRYKESKDVAGIIVGAKYHTNLEAFQTVVGYELNYGHVNVTPTAGLRYVFVGTDDYTDTAGQSVFSKKIDTTTGILEVKLDKQFKASNALILKPELKLGILHDLSNDNGGATIVLANGSSYVVIGEESGGTLLEIGTGLGVNLNNEWQFSVNYEGRFEKNYQDHTALLDVKYAF